MFKQWWGVPVGSTEFHRAPKTSPSRSHRPAPARGWVGGGVYRFRLTSGGHELPEIAIVHAPVLPMKFTFTAALANKHVAVHFLVAIMLLCNLKFSLALLLQFAFTSPFSLFSFFTMLR